MTMIGTGSPTLLERIGKWLDFRELWRGSLMLGSVTTLPNPSHIIHSPWSRDKPRQPLAEGAARTLSSCQQQEHQHQRRSRSDEQHPQLVRWVDPPASSLRRVHRKQRHPMPCSHTTPTGVEFVLCNDRPSCFVSQKDFFQHSLWQGYHVFPPWLSFYEIESIWGIP